MNINEIISYDLSLNPNRKQIQRMLDIAFGKFPGVMFHFNQGRQYQHAHFRNTVKNMGLFNRYKGKVIVMIIVLWKLSLEDIKMKCFMDMKN